MNTTTTKLEEARNNMMAEAAILLAAAGKTKEEVEALTKDFAAAMDKDIQKTLAKASAKPGIFAAIGTHLQTHWGKYLTAIALTGAAVVAYSFYRKEEASDMDLPEITAM